MTDTAAPETRCPTCGRIPAPEPRVHDDEACPTCGTPQILDPVRLLEDALRRENADSGWLVGPD
jgi:uncharacterized OB-fold protein